jgi:transcriptional regulator with XRE-family HTH domain
MTYNIKSVGEAVLDLRKSKGLLKQQFVIELKMVMAVISKIESDK